MSERNPDLPAVPKLNPSFTAVRRSADEVRFLIGPFDGPAYTITDDDEEGVVADLIEQFDGEQTIEEILDSFSSEHRAELLVVIEKLTDRNVLYDGADDSDYGESFGYGTIYPEFGSEELERLQSSTVGIVAPGDLARPLIDDLLGHDLQGVMVHSEDEQFDYRSDTDDQVIFLDGIERVFQRSDLVVSGYEKPAPERQLKCNELAYETGTTWLSGGLQGFDGFVGPTVIPGETSCWECFRQHLAANTKNPEEYQIYEQNANTSPVDPGPLSSAYGRVIAGYLGIELCNRLMFETGYTAGRVISLGFHEMTVEANDVLKVPRCSVCGPDHTASRRYVDFEQYIDD